MEPPQAYKEPASDDAAAATAEKCAKKQRTFGNKLFDWLIYGSISFAGVSTMSLLTVHEAHHGTKPMFNWLRSMNKGFTETLENGIFSKIFKSNPEKSKAWASGTAMFWMLGFGGTALSPILKYLEDNRQKLSAKIDNFFGTTPPDPELIAAEPKQNWLSVFAGRFAAVATGYLSFCALGPKIADNVSKWCGEKATNLITKNRKGMDVTKVRRWMDIAVFDVFFTAVTASVTYVISRIVARNTDDVPDECNTLAPAPKPHAPDISLAAGHNAIEIKPSAKTFAKRAEGYAQAVTAEKQTAPQQLAMT